MYQLVSAIAKTHTGNNRWINLDISNIPLLTLYSDYYKVIVRLTNSFSSTPTSLDLDLIKNQLESSSQTFADFLISNGNTTLPVVTTLYSIQTKYAKYSDAIRAGYKITPVTQNGHLDDPVLMRDRDWLAMIKAGIDYNFFQQHCLVSVNGMIHLCDTDGTKILVKDGNKSARISKVNQIGITNLQTIGSLEFVPITADMIHRRYLNVPLNKRLYIDIGTPKPDKTAALVLGGYLHLLDNSTFIKISDQIYAIDFQNYPLIERYYESKRYIDLSSLALDNIADRPFVLNVPQLYSDVVLTQYATLSQSFLVFINNVDIFTERLQIRKSALPGMFTSYVDPLYPMITGYGKFSDYWRTYEDQQWALNINDGYQDNFQFNSVSRDALNNVSDARDPLNPVELGRAHFLKIGTDLRITSGT